MKRLAIAALALAGLSISGSAQPSLQQPLAHPPDMHNTPATDAQRPVIEHGTTGQGSEDRNRDEADKDARFDPTAREPRRNQPGIELPDD